MMRMWAHVGLVQSRRNPTMWMLSGPQDMEPPDRCFVRPMVSEAGHPVLRSSFKFAYLDGLTDFVWRAHFYKFVCSDAILPSICPSELEIIKEPHAEVEVWNPCPRRRGPRAEKSGWVGVRLSGSAGAMPIEDEDWR